MIQYRVWDTVAKEYLDESAVAINGHGDLAVFDATNIPVATQALSSSSHRFIIEQYTGLKDKNGEKIYKGDILYCVNISFNGVYTDSMVVEESCACNFSHFGEVEVVGNVHENAELSEESK